MNELTKVLGNAAGGDAISRNQLYELVYAELRAIAVWKMASERPGHTLQATALVNEAYLRLGGAERFKFENRAHFFAFAAEAMRRILVDSARRDGQLKRGGNQERLSRANPGSPRQSKTRSSSWCMKRSMSWPGKIP